MRGKVVEGKRVLIRIALDAISCDNESPPEIRDYCQSMLSALAREEDAEFVLYSRIILHSKPTIKNIRVAKTSSLFRGRSVWEQWRLPRQVFADKMDVLMGMGGVMPRWCLLPAVTCVADASMLKGSSLADPWCRYMKRWLPISISRAKAIIVPHRRVLDEIVSWNESLPVEEAKNGRRWWRKEPMLRMTGLEERVHVIPWGVDEAFVRPAIDRDVNAALSDLGLPKHFALMPYRDGGCESSMRILSAWFAAVMKQKASFGLVVLTRQRKSTAAKLFFEAGKLGIAERVKVVYADDSRVVARLHHMADFAIYPWQDGGADRDLIQAVAIGMPVLANAAKQSLFPSSSIEAVKDDSVRSWRECIELMLAQKNRKRKPIPVPTWRSCAEATLAVCRDVVLRDRESRSNRAVLD